MIIIPDVHGRTFWKQSVEDASPEEDILFLGDYLDPYPYEGITPESSIKRFEEILELKKKFPEKVTLLLGNHDLMGYHTDEMGYCRTDLENLERIRKLFYANHGLFQMAAIREKHGKKFVFSHAGILRRWAEMPEVASILSVTPDNLEEIVNRLNRMWQDKDPSLFAALNHISRIRGGTDNYGSPVWADMDEWSREDADYPGFYQIFGHSQQWENAVITRHWANLDCRKAFSL